MQRTDEIEDDQRTMWNLIIGIVFIIGGLSGKLALIGTNSGGALAVVGFGLAGWGAYQLAKKKRDGAP